MRPTAFLYALLFCLGLSVLPGVPSVAEAQPVSRPAEAAAAVPHGPRRADNIEAELVPLSRWAAPGSTVVVAVHQTIAPGWHTYWRNPGDSGGPTTLDWRLPAGVKAGEIVWPLPTRQRLMSLVNYGYSGDVYLPVPIEVPASARPGTTLPLTVDALFLVCSDQMCVPVQMSLRLDLPIREGAPPLDPDHGAAIQAVLEAAPRPAGLDARATLQNGVLTLSATGGPLADLTAGAGAFFTGILAVVVAAPCTAPFMAAALGAALLMPWPAALLIFLMLGLGLGLPYLAVSLSPGLLRRLPRPGPWMDRLKGLLAFPMYGAALWLVWVFSRQTGAEGLALLMAAALTTAFALWLFGLTQAQRALGRSARLSGGSSLIALGAALVLAVIAGRAPVLGAASVAESGPMASAPWSAESVRAAQAEGRPVLVNFTADWCVTCKINERAALSSPRVAEALKATNAVYLVGDWTRRDDAITRELERHGRSGVPLYLLYPANGGEPRILPQLLTEGVVIEALKGT